MAAAFTDSRIAILELSIPELFQNWIVDELLYDP
jgi:hypothetical protein